MARIGRAPRLLVSARGPNEAEEAARGGAAFVDVAIPGSPFGTPYPLNLWSTKGRLVSERLAHLRVSTLIGAERTSRAALAQAALGVCAAGADAVRVAIVEQTLEAAAYLLDSIVRTVRHLGGPGRWVVPVVFVDRDLRRFFDPWQDGPELARRSGADGIQVDTFDKLSGTRILDHASLDDVAAFAADMHEMKLQAWLSGGLEARDLEGLAGTGIDVIGVRGAACGPPRGRARYGPVEAGIVRDLVRRLRAAASRERGEVLQGVPNSW